MMPLLRMKLTEQREMLLPSRWSAGSGFLVWSFAFAVFAVLNFVGVIIVVNLGKLPGQLAHKWNHPLLRRTGRLRGASAKMDVRF